MDKKEWDEYMEFLRGLDKTAAAAAKAKSDILEPKNAEILACHRAITIAVIEVCDNDLFNKLMDEKIKECRGHLYYDEGHNSSICSSLKDLEMIKIKTFDFFLKNIDSVATGMSDFNNRQTWKEILYAHRIVIKEK